MTFTLSPLSEDRAPSSIGQLSFIKLNSLPSAVSMVKELMALAWWCLFRDDSPFFLFRQGYDQIHILQVSQGIADIGDGNLNVRGDLRFYIADIA